MTSAFSWQNSISLCPGPSKVGKFDYIFYKEMTEGRVSGTQAAVLSVCFLWYLSVS